MIKELAKAFQGQFECLGENTEEYITYSVTINKELDNGKLIKYKLKFIDNFGFMSASLSKLNNLSETYSKNCWDKNWKFECEFKGLKNNCKECTKKPVKINKWIN